MSKFKQRLKEIGNISKDVDWAIASKAFVAVSILRDRTYGFWQRPLL